MKWNMPSFMKHAVRYAYHMPDRVGWAAWWGFLGEVVAFEHLDGRMVYDWGEDSDELP